MEAIAEQQTRKRRYTPYKNLQNFFGLTQDDFACLVDVGGGEAVKDLQSIKESLEALFEPKEIRRWLHTPKSMFAGKTPIEIIAKGEADRILEILTRLEEGIHN